jgi:hypothetical protein
MVTIAKTTYIRSKKLLESVRLLPCQICGIEDGTVVAAHSNQAKHGKGRGIKASDVYIAALCHSCHMEIDQGHKLSKDERTRLWDTAHLTTVWEMIYHDLWPKDIPLPDTYEYWKKSATN